ncbi:tigger transposable element-derived protein 2-like [Bombus huntii]|uniref:tigger transposable element-derived protein 2-like n=1 Tax=Bombus huntii TaxID=85661 RepID=UPI0021AA38F1|nr:tigger transposable element-derived protein 2-like [Bombus huntii]
MELSRYEKRIRRRAVDVDGIVHQWYLRCKERNEQMTIADIKRRALEINMKLMGSPSFRAGRTWLLGFKERYSITNADVKETVPAKTETAAARVFKADFIRFLLERQITLRNVYNVVYTTIMWKIVPERTCIMDHAKSTENLEMCEDYVTAVFCANATGCRKLPVLLIGTEPVVHALYNYDTEAFSTIYKSKENACMDSTIFKDWYENLFLESVKERQRENAPTEQYLLLLDNAMSLHNLNDLHDLDRSVTIMSLPVKVSPLRQPMNCGIISCFTRKYRIELLKTMMLRIVGDTVQDMMDVHKEISMWDCCQFAHNAWSSVDDAILRSSWDSLLVLGNVRNIGVTEKWEADLQEVLKITKELPGCEKCVEIDVYNWFYIEKQYDIVKKKCADEVIQKYKDNPVNIDNIDDEAGPSRAKLSKRS